MFSDISAISAHPKHCTSISEWLLHSQCIHASEQTCILQVADGRSSYLLILKTCLSRGNERWTPLLKWHGTRQSAVNNVFKYIISHTCIDGMEETHFLMSVCKISRWVRNVSRHVESTAWIWLSPTTDLWLVYEGITKTFLQRGFAHIRGPTTTEQPSSCTTITHGSGYFCLYSVWVL